MQRKLKGRDRTRMEPGSSRPDLAEGGCCDELLSPETGNDWMINAESLRITRIAIAYLFQNVVPLERKDNLAFYDEVTREGADFPELHQLPRELVLLRKLGAQQAEVRVGAMDVIAQGAQPNPAAFRLLIAEIGSSQPVKFFADKSDTVYEKFRDVWGGRLGQLQLVEVSIQGTVAAGDDGGAAGFFQNRVLGFDKGLQGHLGREFNQFGVKLGSSVIVDVGTGAPDPTTIPGAQVEFNLETSPQDPRVLTFQLLVKWPMIQLRLSGMQMPPEVRAKLGGQDFVEMNRDPKMPNTYIDSVYNYLERRVLAFLKAAGR